MLIIPDLVYIETTNFRPFYKNTYLEKDDSFTGYVLYYELDGSFTNGWRYENGLLTQTVNETSNRFIGYREELPRMKSRNCDEYDIYQIIEECTEHYTYVEYGDYTSNPEYSHTTCEYSVEIGGSYYVCEYTGTGGSHGGGGYNPPAEPIDPNMEGMKNFYSTNSNLGDSQKQSLLGSYEALCNSKPTIERMCNRLAEKKKKIVFKVEKTSQGDPAEYQAGTIRFNTKNDISSYHLEEELIHAYQNLI